MSEDFTEYDRIYLAPSCAKCMQYGIERLWCEHPEEPCSECGGEWVEFKRVERAHTEREAETDG
jgi:hypothetical protein